MRLVSWRACMDDVKKVTVSRRRVMQLMASLPVAGALAGTSQAQGGTPAVKMASVARAPRPEKEVRAIWIHPEQHISAGEKEGKAQIKTMVERFAAANFNLLLPWTVSGYLAALDQESYRKSHPTAAWDYLGVLIDEAAKAGLDVDMWYSFTDYRAADSPEFNLAMGGSPEWMAKRLDEVVP